MQLRFELGTIRKSSRERKGEIKRRKGENKRRKEEKKRRKEEKNIPLERKEGGQSERGKSEILVGRRDKITISFLTKFKHESETARM